MGVKSPGGSPPPILYGFCAANFVKMRVNACILVKFKKAKNLSLGLGKSEGFEGFKYGSLGRTRTCDQVINSHTGTPLKTKSYNRCTDFVRQTQKISNEIRSQSELSDTFSVAASREFSTTRKKE